MRTRVVGENQDESKWPLKRRRTRHGTLRKPSMEECNGYCHHCLTRVATDNSAYCRTRVVSTATNMMISIISHPGCRHRSSSPPTSTQLLCLRHACTPVLRASVTTAHLHRARSCRVCDTRVPLFSELPITAANLYPNSKAYKASLSFESPPRVKRCIQVFEYTPSQPAYL
jgi:hypothetical protein